MTRDAGRRARPKHPPVILAVGPSEREAEERGVDGTPTSPASCPPEMTEKPKRCKKCGLPPDLCMCKEEEKEKQRKGVGVPETAVCCDSSKTAENGGEELEPTVRRVKPQPLKNGMEKDGEKLEKS